MTRITRVAHVGSAYALLAVYWGGVRLWPRWVVRQAVQASGRSDDTNDSAVENTSQLRRITSAVERAAALHPLDVGCLEKALAARLMLAIYGEPATVVVGIRKTSGALDAHAWVEVRHCAVDADRRRFADFMQLR